MANKTTSEICDWYEEFQSIVNTLTGSDSLKFTMEIWKPNSPPEEVPRYSDKITVCRDEAFPYLDLEMYWRNVELQFRVHLKPNQNSSTLVPGLPHRPPCENPSNLHLAQWRQWKKKTTLNLNSTRAGMRSTSQFVGGKFHFFFSRISRRRLSR